jgi:hypothetical protein
MTIDTETMRLYEEMKAAVRDGDLLSYAGKLARTMMGRVSGETDARETIFNSDSIRPPTPQQRSMEQQTARSNNSPVRRELSEGSRVSDL